MDGKVILANIRSALGESEKTALGKISSESPEDPFRVLIGTILSHRTRDERTAEATERLFRAYRTASELSSADRSDVAELIRGVGFYNVKSARIIEVAGIVSRELGGRVPDTIEGLMELPAVGRKTANCVLVYGFGKDAIPVDTHVHRIANRLGIARTSSPDETEAALTKFFAKEDWLDVNDLFVSFGKTVCKPIGPRCGGCPLRRECQHCAETAKNVDKRKRNPK